MQESICGSQRGMLSYHGAIIREKQHMKGSLVGLDLADIDVVAVLPIYAKAI